jgi:hypothetical protein
MKDFTDLEPGLYVARGDNIKSLKTLGYRTTFEGLLSGDSESSPSIARLAASVAWVFIALEKRKEMLLEIPYTWTLNGEETEDTPFDMPFLSLIQQQDEAIQLYAQAFDLKRRVGSRVVGVRWLNPLSVRPDYDTATPDNGIVRYEYTNDLGQTQWLAAEDVLHFIKPGMDELRPGTAAAQATSMAAAILRGIEQTTDTFYDNNALPVMLVKVPAATSEPELERTGNEIRRLFNRMAGTKEVRVRGVRADVEVMPLSFEPEKLAQAEITDQEINAILAAHGIQKSVAIGDASNYATDISADRRTVRTLGQRLDTFARTYNADPDFQAAGWQLVVKLREHEAMKEDEARRSESYVNYTVGGFTPEAAAHLVGIHEESFPPDMQVFAGQSPTEPEQTDIANTQAQTGSPQTGDVSTAQEAARERQAEAKAIEKRQLRNWLKKRKRPDITDFEAQHLSDGEKAFILLEEVGFAQDAPFQEREEREWPSYP